MRENVEVPIQVTVVEKRGKKRGKVRLHLDKMSVHANTGDVIAWRWKSSAKKAFTILFPGDSPFNESEYACERNKIKQTISYKPGRRMIKEKVFKYIIAGYYKGMVRILDPEIIVPKPGKF